MWPYYLLSESGAVFLAIIILERTVPDAGIFSDGVLFASGSSSCG